MPVGSRAVAAAQQGEPVVEAAVDVLDRHRAHPGGGELDGQGEPVEPAHDTQHRGRVERDTGPRGPGSLPEQLGCRVVVELREGEDPLGGDREGRPGRGHHAQAGARRHQEGHEVGDGLDHVLAVVEDEQGRCRAQCLCGPGSNVVALLGREHPPAAHRVAHAQGRPDLADDVVGRGDADQLDEVHDRLLGLPAEEVSEPGLAQAPGAEDRHDPGLADQGAQRADVVVATDEGRRLVAQPGPDRVVGGEQLGVHRGQGRARVDAEALGEVAAHLRVAVEGCGAAVHGPQGTQQGRGRLLVADTGLLEEGECLAVVAERRQRPAQHRTRLGPQPARVVTQGGQRAVAAGCR